MCTERLKYDLSDMMLLQLQTFVQNPGNRSAKFWVVVLYDPHLIL